MPAAPWIRAGWHTTVRTRRKKSRSGCVVDDWQGGISRPPEPSVYQIVTPAGQPSLVTAGKTIDGAAPRQLGVVDFMGVLNAVRDLFSSGDVIALDERPAAGEARASVVALIADLLRTQPGEVRGVSTDQYLETVVEAKRLQQYCDRLTGPFGEPSKPFGARGRFTPALAEKIEGIGGVMPNQCLFLRRFADDEIAYAALWPWGDATSVTLKVGVLDR